MKKIFFILSSILLVGNAIAAEPRAEAARVGLTGGRASSGKAVPIRSSSAVAAPIAPIAPLAAVAPVVAAVVAEPEPKVEEKIEVVEAAPVKA